MKFAAVRTISDMVSKDEWATEHIVPNPQNPNVSKAAAAAVAEAAIRTGVAGKQKRRAENAE